MSVQVAALEAQCATLEQEQRDAEDNLRIQVDVLGAQSKKDRERAF